jgi:hypothetical protein
MVGHDGVVADYQSASTTADQHWFSVRCVFAFVGVGASAAYEERVTLWRAAAFDEAVALAETEALDYAELVECRYLGLAQAYHLADDLGHGAEVYSLIRDSDLPPDVYLSRFFDTGMERQGAHLASEPGSGE